MRFAELVIHDVRFAVRGLGRNRAFAATIVLMLALGIGANLAIFAVVNAVLLQPLPFHDPDRIVRIFSDAPGAGARDLGISVPELQDLGQRSGVFTDISALFPASTALSGGDRVERIELLGTSPGYFELLGAKAALGRVYGQAEWRPGFLEGVVISDALWKRQFGADPHIIGRRIRVDEDPYTIIGVMPPGFRHPGNTLSGDVDLWAAAGFTAAPFPPQPIRAARFLPGAIGRLAAGVTLTQAQQRLDALATQLRTAYPNDYPPQWRWALRIEPAQASLTGNVRPMLVMLLAAVGFVLLIVCVNVAGLLLARSTSRMREVAIRQALGASRRRLAAQLLIESLLLSLTGGAIALLLLGAVRGPLLAMAPADVPRLVEVHTDWRTVAFALGASMATGLLFGLAPALHASSVDPVRGLNEGGRGGGEHGLRQSRWRAALVVLEVALSVVLLVGAGLLLRSFSAVLRQNPGLEPHGLVAGQIWVPVPNNPEANRYLAPAQQAGLVRRLLDRLAQVPGVRQIALGTSGDLPLLNNSSNAVPFSLPDEPQTRDDSKAAQFGSVSAGYVDGLKIPLIAGRFFTDHDDANAPRVVVVNQAFARRFGPRAAGRSIVGERLRVGRGTDFQIVGVVGDIRSDGLDVLPEPHVYASILQRPSVALAVFLRTSLDARTTRDALTRAVHDVDPELPVFAVRTMEELMSSSMARRRFSLELISGFAASALVLAALGLYGIVAFVVRQRQHEFGVRIALGAQPRDIARLVLRPGLMLTATGIIVGIGASAGVTRLISALLVGVSPEDPPTLLGVGVLLMAVTAAACLIPISRALRISPTEALRS